MPCSRLRSLAIRVLAIFVATICATLLAPVMASPDYASVCSAHGTHRGAAGDATADPHADVLVHCPLCMPAGVPPTAVACDFAPVNPLANVLRCMPAARLAGPVGAPLPARGPPTLS